MVVQENREYFEKINQILNREKTEKQIIQLLSEFGGEKNTNVKKGLYILGSSGVGKTSFIMNILKKLNYDIIRYDAVDTRNKQFIESITNNHISSNHILNMFYKRKQKIVILMDEIEAITSGEKSGISSLIKLIRPKKTKRQQEESQTYHPIICIGNYFVDKKIKELMKVCNIFELNEPTEEQMMNIAKFILPATAPFELNELISFCKKDLNKLFLMTKLMKKNPNKTIHFWTTGIHQQGKKNYDTKKITQLLLHDFCPFNKQNQFINETDRTIVSLLLHENIVDSIDATSISPVGKNNDAVVGASNINIYNEILSNICFADYIDRITFQNQIWLFNEMSFLIKTMNVNRIYHLNKKMSSHKFNDIRFTKILTKYSTEYNNINFINSLCIKMDCDKKDLIGFFQECKIRFGSENIAGLNQKDITKLDIKRIFRFLEHKNIRGGQILNIDDENESVDEEEIEI